MDAFLVLENFFQYVQDSTYNLTLTLSFIAVLFWMVHNFSEDPVLSIVPFQKVQRKVIYFPHELKK